MKIYTKTGDQGETGLFGGPRVAKDDTRIEAYGAVDELNAALGLARSLGLPDEVERVLGRVQEELFAVGAELAAPDPSKLSLVRIGQQQIEAMERDIDYWDSRLTPLKNFIIPGGTPSAAALHVARTVCRRAERRVVELTRPLTSEATHQASHVLCYLNRLSDLLFVAARFTNSAKGVRDPEWTPESPFESSDKGPASSDEAKG